MNDNLIEVNDKKLREIQLEILSAVASFCESHHINYWLDFGTLIGAVRHKGYIPWDDDVDLGMMREDYIKFIELFNQENTRYKFMCYEIDKSFPYPFGKVLDTETVLYEPDERGHKLSINIDIFPYDNIPDAKTAKKLYKKRDRYSLFQVAKIHKGKAQGNFVRRFFVACLKLFVKIFPRDYFVKKIIKNAKKYSDCNTAFVGDLTGSLTNFTCDKSVFDCFLETEFEGKMFKIPRGYDELLRMVYGDYMQFPPESQRVSHHRFKAYIKES